MSIVTLQIFFRSLSSVRGLKTTQVWGWTCCERYGIVKSLDIMHISRWMYYNDFVLWMFIPIFHHCYTSRCLSASRRLHAACPCLLVAPPSSDPPTNHSTPSATCLPVSFTPEPAQTYLRRSHDHFSFLARLFHINAPAPFPFPSPHPFVPV